MKHLKLFEFYDKEKYLIDWLSVKFNKDISHYLGSGMTGIAYNFGKDKVIKLSKSDELASTTLLNKNIEGVAKIYSHGEIKVPKRMITYNDNGMNTINIDKRKTLYSDEESLYYIIMEKLNVSKELEYKIEDIAYLIGDYLRMLGDFRSGIPTLRQFFLRVDNDEFVREVYNYCTKIDSEDEDIEFDEEIFAELVVILRNVSDKFDWKDIHSGQFGLNSKGHLVAFDFDTPLEDEKLLVKNTIRESTSIRTFKSFNQSLIYDEESEGGSVQGIIHYDENKINNWFYKRNISSKEYTEHLDVPVAFLNNINVSEEERNKGYGQQMYEEFEDWCIENMATGIILESDSYESQQEGFNLDEWYIKLGFGIIGESGDNKIMFKSL